MATSNPFIADARFAPLRPQVDFSKADGQLLNAFQKGNELAFASIYEDNCPLPYAFGARLPGDKGLVEDAIQKVFIEAFFTRIWKYSEVLSYKKRNIVFPLTRKFPTYTTS